MNGVSYKYGNYRVTVYTGYNDKQKCGIPDCVGSGTITVIKKDKNDFWELRLCQGCTIKYDLDTFDVRKQSVGIALLRMKELI